ncbi:MAG: Slp family lipoprotein [Candidatus Methylomirabilales bacterium]
MRSTPPKRNTLLVPGLLVLAATLVACASVVPDGLKERARSLPLAKLQQAPERYSGTLLVLGGEVVAVKPQGEWIEIQVVERPLGLRDRPRTDRAPRGRFAVLVPHAERNEQLDKVRPGRLVTVAGEVQGRTGSSTGKASDGLPLLLARYIHLWPPPLFPGGPGMGFQFRYQGSIGF